VTGSAAVHFHRLVERLVIQRRHADPQLAPRRRLQQLSGSRQGRCANLLQLGHCVRFNRRPAARRPLGRRQRTLPWHSGW
jgi:hypothetical protein